MRFPRELVLWHKGGRKFNYNQIADGVYIGRIPRSREDIKHLKQVRVYVCVCVCVCLSVCFYVCVCACACQAGCLH